MQLKTWSSEKTLFWKDIRRFWPVWAAYLLIWLFLGPISMVSDVNGSTGFTTLIASDFLRRALMPGIWLAFAFGIISAMAVFSYLYSSRSANAEASLPIRRTAQFFAHYLAGLFWLTAANLIVFLLAALPCIAFGPVCLGAAAQWLAIVTLMDFIFYTFAAFCAMLTGNILALPAVYAIFNFVCPAVEVLAKELCRNMIFGLDIGGVATKILSPALMLSTSTNIYSNFPDAPGVAEVGTTPAYGLVYNGWSYLFLYAGLSAAFLFLAALLYKRRRMETAGDIVSIDFLKPIFKYCMAFGCALVGAVALGNLLSVSDSVPATLILMLFWGFVGYFGSEMLIQKTFRVFSAWQGYAAVSAVVILFITVCATDAFGVAGRVPAADKVQSVCISTVGEYVELDEQASIEAVQALHRRLINREGEAAPGLSAIYSYYRISISYELKSGFQFSRSYIYLLSDDALSDKDSIGSAVDGIINCTEAIAERKSSAIPVVQDNIESAYLYLATDDIGYINLTPEQAEYIYQNGVLKDMSAGDIGRVWLWQGAQYNKEILEDGCEISIALSRYNEQTKKFESDEFYTYVLSSSVHTYACLRELDILN